MSLEELHCVMQEGCEDEDGGGPAGGDWHLVGGLFPDKMQVCDEAASTLPEHSKVSKIPL